MRKAIFALIMFPLISPTGVCFSETTYHSPLAAVAVGPDGPSSSLLTVEAYGDSSPALVITAPGPVAEEDDQWVLIPLTVKKVKIHEVRVCYKVEALTAEPTFISEIQLTRMNQPDDADDVHRDETDLESTEETCYKSRARPSFKATGTITLALKVVFGSPGDEIRIGGIRLR
jgi:hypothetical protein